MSVLTRSKGFTIWLGLALGVVAATRVAFAGAPGDPQAGSSLVGVWRVLSAESASASINPAQPGLFIFTQKYYSMIQVTTASPRQLLQPTPTTPIADVVEVYVQGFQAQSGSYTVSGNTLTITPEVAKNPAIMTGTTQQHFTWKLDGRALQLIGPEGRGPTDYRLERLE